MVDELYVNELSATENALLDLELSDLELFDELFDLELSESESEPEPALLDSKVLDPVSVSVGVVSPLADLSLDS